MKAEVCLNPRCLDTTDLRGALASRAAAGTLRMNGRAAELITAVPYPVVRTSQATREFSWDEARHALEARDGDFYDWITVAQRARCYR